MSSKKELRIGLIGTGLMARAHSNGYNRIGNFFPELEYRPVLKVVCSRTADKVKAFAEQWGYESFETDWKAVIARDDIDAVDICTPNDMHADIAIAAAEAGKMVLCEKPLARTVAEAQPMVDAVAKAGVANTVWYNYRRAPAVTLIKQIIDSGKLGKIFHYRGNFLQDWTINPELPQGGEGLWR
jgi:predicted dehydrogenase